MKRFACLPIVCLALAACALASACASSSGGGSTGGAATGAADVAGADASQAADVAGNSADSAAPADAAAGAETAAVADAGADVAAAPCNKEVVSKSSMYKLCLDGPDSLKSGTINSYVATIIAADKFPDGFAPTVKFIHIQMGHGGFKTPTIAQDGDSNQFKIANIAPSMPGLWRLIVTLSKGDDASWDIPAK